MRFESRRQAGQMLAQKLQAYKHEHCIIYAIPRGGVPVGAEIARYLNAPLELIIPRKISHPSMPEYAVAAVTENGTVIYNEEVADILDPEWLNQAVEAEQTEATRRRRTYLKGRRYQPPKKNIAIIVDDGIATSLTMQAALSELTDQQPRHIVVAVPVSPAAVTAQLAAYADEIITVISDQDFKGAVGAYYDNFTQTSDEEVIGLLNEATIRNRRFNAQIME